MLRKLTSCLHVVIIDNMKAGLILSAKEIISESELTEIVVWSIPTPVDSSDLCHLDGLEHRYQFISIDQLVDDFFAEVDKRGGKS